MSKLEFEISSLKKSQNVTTICCVSLIYLNVVFLTKQHGCMQQKIIVSLK